MNDQDWDETMRALHDKSDMDRAVAAAQKLHKTATKEDLPKLMKLLDDDNFFVQEAAAWPACELGGSRALQELLVAYQQGLDRGHDNDGFTAALIDLVETNPKESREVLSRLAESGDAPLRENALWLLEFCTESSGG